MNLGLGSVIVSLLAPSPPQPTRRSSRARIDTRPEDQSGLPEDGRCPRRSVAGGRRAHPVTSTAPFREDSMMKQCDAEIPEALVADGTQYGRPPSRPVTAATGRCTGGSTGLASSPKPPCDFYKSRTAAARPGATASLAAAARRGTPLAIA